MYGENLLEEDSHLPSGFHRAGGWGRGSVKVCRKGGGLCPQARIVNSLHCFCKKLFKKKKTVLVS